VSVGVVGTAAYLVLHVSWAVALLVGAVLTSTDAAAVFSVLRRVPLPRRVTGVLEAESGFNDAPVVILVVALSDQAAHPGSGHAWWGLVLLAVAELAGGAAIGVTVGWLGGQGLRRLSVQSSALFSLAVLSLTVVAYAASAVAHTSGFLATYVAALVLGNSRLPHRAATRGFAEALGWLAQIGLFVLLGLLASPARLGHQVLPALALGLVLVLVARPLSVVVSLTPFRLPWREQAFLSWAGLRGAVPIVLALVPLTTGMAGARELVDAVFVLVVVLTLVQGTTLPVVARMLGLAAPTVREIEVDAAPLESVRADLLQMTVPDGSKMHGVYVRELRLPDGAGLSLVVRSGASFTPQDETRLQEGDQLLVVATTTARDAAERRLRAVDRSGRLARWRGDTGGTPTGRPPRGDPPAS
jgi:cell volume regulation protein A